jgi:PhnB protein
MRVDIYLNYPGNCEQAFRFYAKELGGRITTMMRHGDAPDPRTPAEWKQAILHGRVELGNATLMGADIPNAQPMRSAYVTLTLDSVEETERVYGVLSEGGEIFMKLEQTFFARRFAMLRDRFGTSWMLLHDVQAAKP